MKTKLTVILSLSVVFVLAAGRGAAQTSAAQGGKPAAKPQLTEAQLQAIKSIRSESEKRAAVPALRLASTVKQIYDNMLAEKEDEALRQTLDRELDEVAVVLLAIKGQSIREMVRVLTPEQKQLLKSEMMKPDAPADLSELIARVFNIAEK